MQSMEHSSQNKSNNNKKVFIVTNQQLTTGKNKFMKKQSGPLFFSLSLNDQANSTTQTEETVSAGFNLQHQKLFTIVDMWNIQRQRRCMIQRRFSF